MNTDEHRFKDFGQTDLRLGELRRVNTEILRCVQDDSIAWEENEKPDRRAGLLCLHEVLDPTHRDKTAMNGAPCICAKRVSPSAKESDAHGHEDVAVLDVFGGVFWAHLAGGLGVLELQADLAGVADGL